MTKQRSCHILFTRAFFALRCVFLVITLIGSIKVSTRKTQHSAETARINVMCKCAFNGHVATVLNNKELELNWRLQWLYFSFLSQSRIHYKGCLAAWLMSLLSTNLSQINKTVRKKFQQEFLDEAIFCLLITDFQGK